MAIQRPHSRAIFQHKTPFAMTLQEKRDMYVFFHKMDQIAEAKQRRLQRLQEEKQKKRDAGL